MRDPSPEPTRRGVRVAAAGNPFRCCRANYSSRSRLCLPDSHLCQGPYHGDKHSRRAGGEIGIPLPGIVLVYSNVIAHAPRGLAVMYIALLMLLLAVGGALVFNGVQRHRPQSLFAGSLILLFTGLFFGLLSFWGEMLWFEELRQSQRF